MPTPTKYDFTISTAFANGVVPARLEGEIQSSSISIALDRIDTTESVCSVWFKDALSTEDVTTLDGVVAAHQGKSLPNAALPVEIYTGAAPQPVAADGKPFVLPNSFPGEVLLNFAGCSDGLSPAVRFGGTIFGIQQAGVGKSSQTIDLLDGIFLAGGHVEWEGGSWGNNIYMELLAPASTVKDPASPGTGNCNLVPTGLGFNIIVPAPGNGAKDIDVPVPVPSYDDESGAQTGYWNYSEPWLGKGAVSPATGNGKYNLYDIPLELAHFCKIHIFRETGWRDMIAPAIKPKWILPEWKIKVEIENTDANKTLKVGWDLLIARRKSV